MQSSKRRQRVAAALLFGASLSLSGCSVIATGRPARDEPSASQAPLPEAQAAPAQGLAAGVLDRPLDTENAAALAEAMLLRRSWLRTLRDEGAFRSIAVEPQLSAEVSRLRQIKCCAPTPPIHHEIDLLTVAMPPVDDPGFFIARANVHRTAEPTAAYQYQAVFVRLPEGIWRIAMVATGVSDRALYVGESSGSDSLTQGQARQLLSDVGDYYESWYSIGHPTAARQWGDGMSEAGAALWALAKETVARDYGVEKQTYGVPASSRVWVARTDTGHDIVCGSVPAEISRDSRPGKVLTQGAKRSQWGAQIPPGRYVSWVEQSPYFVCVETPDAGRRIDLIGHERWAVSAAVVPEKAIRS
ncbi:MAG: hypothetical protein ABIM89_07695 [Mycobacteriales bacterium]